MHRENNTMNCLKQRGYAEVLLLFSLLMLFVVIYWIHYDAQQAPAEDVVALVSLASPVPEAKTRLRALLQVNPHPTRKDIKRFKSEINAVIVNNTVASVTGANPSGVHALQPTLLSANWLSASLVENWKLLTVITVLCLVLLHPITRAVIQLVLEDLVKLATKARAKRS